MGNPSWETNEDSRPEGYSPKMGRRVFVMSLAGEALQTYDMALEAGHRVINIGFLGENLVINTHNYDAEPRLIALKGL